MHYTFEDTKLASQGSESRSSAEEWLDALQRAKDLAISQNPAGSYGSDTAFGEMSSSFSSPSSTLDRRVQHPEGFSISDRSGRNHLSKNQASMDESSSKKNRFSKRQSKNGLGPAF